MTWSTLYYWLFVISRNGKYVRQRCLVLQSSGCGKSRERNPVRRWRFFTWKKYRRDSVVTGANSLRKGRWISRLPVVSHALYFFTLSCRIVLLFDALIVCTNEEKLYRYRSLLCYWIQSHLYLSSHWNELLQ